MKIIKVAMVLIFIFLLHASAFAYEYRIFTDPRGAFQMDIPVGWEAHEQTNYGFRYFTIAPKLLKTPQDVAEFEGPVLTMGLMGNYAFGDDLNKIANENYEEIINISKKLNVKYYLIDERDLMLGKYKGRDFKLKTVAQSGWAETKNVLTVDANKYYVKVMFKAMTNEYLKDKQVFLKALKTFKLLGKEKTDIKFTKHENKEAGYSVMVPKGWKIKKDGEKNSYQETFFYKNNKNNESEGNYVLGIIKNNNVEVNDYEKNTKNDPALMILMDVFEKYEKDFMAKYICLTLNEDIGELQGNVFEWAYVAPAKGKYVFMTMINATVYDKDNKVLYMISFTTPTEEIEQYRHVFNEAIESIDY
ncbi:MAG: hypothetical protein ABIA63_10930 [bacterium]